MKYYEAQVIEDNGGGLYLFIFGRGGICSGNVIYATSGYENRPGSSLYESALLEDIEVLLAGCDDPRIEWDGCDPDPKKLYASFREGEPGWEIVAEIRAHNFVTYPKRMGVAAQLALKVSDNE